MENIIGLNKKWKHFVDGSGNIYKSGLVNGYDYGDRILEDVMFEIAVQDSGELSVKVEESAKEYFSELNEEHWYSVILESIERNGEATIKVDKNTFIDVLFIDLDVIPTPKSSISELFKKMEASNAVEQIKEETEDISQNIPQSVSDLNEAIQVMNNSKSNITANPDVLKSLGIEDDVEDPDFVEFNTKLNDFHQYIKDDIEAKKEELSTLNAMIDKSLYWETYYKVEFYNTLLSKFFDKEYLTHPKIRFSKISTFLEEVVYKFTAYLKSINYKITNQEEIEAYEKEYLAKNLSTQFFTPERKKVEVKTNDSKVDLKTLGSTISTETKSKLSDILKKIELGESLEKEKEASEIAVLSEYDKADLKGKISIKYNEVYARAIVLDGEDDGLIKTYIETLYNPVTTSLDDKNLLLNLLIVSKMQDFGVMNWDFDNKSVKVSNTETNLEHDWWTKILSENIEEDMKHVKIVEKELNLAFYTSFLSDILKNADKLSYGERNLKFKKLLSDNPDDDTSREGLLLDNILKKTHNGSILFITPDMEKFIHTENVINEELGNKGQLKYIGTWKERIVFVINVDKIRGLEQYSSEIVFVNKGNSYVVNPEKPIVYFNVIDNPFLKRPIIKWFAGADFKISMDKATRMRVDNSFLE